MKLPIESDVDNCLVKIHGTPSEAHYEDDNGDERWKEKKI